ncbi:DUF2141 domain-containing protein [Subsaximicrobium wynnwilliamsii]|uniref:DUF2141 domain-containing protein n=1 Tax=Subsaximicrobium wynnwilliamsii TaxID=291179 RepID=A0A5C6ZFV9_9FLAO|nr:DUF2141 domain-containing protein [Subsaximicrobium wynnwilliamsii]TXD82784.1 DUF2141 domain-containing protein [Subsaximicrobium wynnwilliamsii]TXD88508.1 DUF2141 domain-containing protein [Subsaximicrobium wynnwilliamsii]TXE02496.1 DUF2141 domain-containing protein [Subsaximicrobium wynnwilliamsii]
MSTLAKIFIFAILSQTFSNAQEPNLKSITVKIQNLSSNQGMVYVALYNAEATFLGKGIQSSKTMVSNKSCEVVFKNLPEGVYAVSFFHDENGNGKLDTNFMGIPKETYGCSNNAQGFMGPPKWSDAKFEMSNENIEQTITL